MLIATLLLVVLRGVQWQPRLYPNILVLESAPELAEIGAGLQVTPNATRLLRRWDLAPRLEKVSSSPKIFTIHRYSDGELLGQRHNYGPEMLKKYKSEFWDVHRADLQIAMFDRATELGVTFRFGVTVTGHDFKAPAVILESGERLKCDLIIAADGLWSARVLPSSPRPPRPYPRATLPIASPSVSMTFLTRCSFFSTPRVTLWVGPHCHVICYPLKANTLLNLVLLVPDNLSEGVAKAEGDLDEMRAIFAEWGPRLRSLLSMVNKVDKWKLMHLDEMEHWSNAEGTVAFLGDACHPMLPYLAQGAGSSLEDGAALGILLSKAHHREDLPNALKLYEELRKPRSSSLQKRSMKQRYVNHLPNGPEQQDRDQLLTQQFNKPLPGYPFYWLDPAAQQVVYGYNVLEELGKLGTKSSVGAITNGRYMI